MAETSFVLGPDALQALEQLKRTFGVTSSADALARALTLAGIAAKNADDKNELTIVTKDNKEQKILLSG